MILMWLLGISRLLLSILTSLCKGGNQKRQTLDKSTVGTVNIGRMTIKGLQLDINDDTAGDGKAKDVKPKHLHSKRRAVTLMQFVHEELEAESFLVDNEVGKVPVSGVLCKRKKVSIPPSITSPESHEKGNFRPSSLDLQSPDSF